MLEKLKNLIQHKRKQVNMEIEKLKNYGSNIIAKLIAPIKIKKLKNDGSVIIVRLIEEAILRRRKQKDKVIEKLKKWKGKQAQEEEGEVDKQAKEISHSLHLQPAFANLPCDDEPHFQVMFREGVMCMYSMQ